MRDFQGLVAVVTGGASGIGAATAAELTRRGARVAVLDRDLTAVTSDAGSIHHLQCDITSDHEVARAISTIHDELDGLDVVVNSAGIGATGDVGANDRAEWHRVLDVNVVSTARVVAAALPLLRLSEHAAIVNLSSVVATVGVRNRALYSASKGAVSAMTLAMAADLVSDGIRVNAVAPGTADTPWVAHLLDAAADPVAEAIALRARQPMGRLVSPGEVAWAVCYLASPLAASTTGTILGVDGGMATLKV